MKDIPHARSDLTTSSDPYLAQEIEEGTAVCKGCGAVYRNKRWYLSVELTDEERREAKEVLCPACRKVRDRMPEGIVLLSGKFLAQHKEEILNLARNEEENAMGLNPLERIMEIVDRGEEVEITTTSEHLAQRIGRAVQSAYSGELQIKFSEDVKLTRVSWRREK